METNSILWIIGILGVLLLLSGYSLYTSKKKDRGTDRMAIGALAAFAAFGLIFGVFAPITITPTDEVAPIAPEDLEICAITGPLPVANLSFMGDTWRQSGANSPTGPAGDVQIYLDGTDVTIPGVTPLDTISVTAGVGSTTSKAVKSCTDYEFYYDGGATVEYDQKHPTGRVVPIVTDTGQIPFRELEFRDIKVVAAIGDLIEEDATDGTINGQSNVNGTAACDGEIQSGADSSPADGDTLYYNKTNGDTQIYFDIEIEATGGDKVLQEPVLCFVNLANPMEGDEISLASLTYRSGNNFGAPVTITDYVSNQKCVPLGDEMISGESGTYRLQLTIVEANADAGTDIMYVYLDDLGEHLGEDLLGGKKATPAGFVLGFR